MNKWSFRIILSGVIIGAIAGIITCYIALDHNPQNEYTDNPEDLFPIFYGWMSVASFPFTFSAALLETWRLNKTSMLLSLKLLLAGALFGSITGGVSVWLKMDGALYASFAEIVREQLPLFLGSSGAVSLPFTCWGCMQKLIEMRGK